MLGADNLPGMLRPIKTAMNKDIGKVCLQTTAATLWWSEASCSPQEGATDVAPVQVGEPLGSCQAPEHRCLAACCHARSVPSVQACGCHAQHHAQV